MNGDDIRSRSTPRRSVVISAALLLLTACVKEFPIEATKTAQVRPIDWRDTILVTDTVRLAVSMVTADDVVITGARVTWHSSDENVIRLLPPVPSVDTSRRARSEQFLHATFTARAVGAAEISAQVDMPGILDSAFFRQTIAVSERWLSISAGYTHSCGVTIAHIAFCWGGGLRFLGSGSTVGSVVPSRVVGGLSFLSVAAGWEHSCGLNTDGLAYCWGYNPWGAIGNGTTDDQLAPVPIARGPKLSVVSAGVGFTCGISDLQTALCWGDNRVGQLGSLDSPDHCGAEQTLCGRSWGVVRDASGLAIPVTNVAAGDAHACAVQRDGTPICWGDNSRGLLGTGDTMSSRVPRPVATTARFRGISSGQYHTCGVSTEGVAYCWGTNLFGELGSGPDVSVCDGYPCTRTPRPVSTSVSFVDVRAGGRTTCGLTGDGTVYCWGLGDVGQLGTTTGLGVCVGRPCSRGPVVAAAGRRFRSISVGEGHVCGVDVLGGAFCWGDNTGGKLGSGGVTPSALARRVSNPTQ